MRAEMRGPAPADSGASVGGVVAEPPEPPALGPDDPSADWQVYEPHKIGLPPLGTYLAELWRRRQFAFEMARTNLRAQHYNTALGQLWLVMNPLLLAFVYFLLVDILRKKSGGSQYFAHLMAGLFAFYFVSGAVTQGARSVVGGGRLILNTAFPRTLLPLSAVMTGFMRFLPTFVIYGVVHGVAGLPVGLHLLWIFPIVALLVVFASGVSMLAAAAQVYFRDVASFLPYVMRIWMYGSPVLYYVEEVPNHLKSVLSANPLYPLLGSWSDVLIRGHAPPARFLLAGLAWAVGALLVGSLVFMSREREFAVRL